MRDRDRLIAIVKDSLIRNIGKSCKLAENITDDLINEGVIVLPCKVGQQLWFVENGKVKCSTVDRLVYEEVSTDDIFTRIEGYGFSVFFEDIGKTVFLTREEAEKALERSKG